MTLAAFGFCTNLCPTTTKRLSLVIPRRPKPSELVPFFAISLPHWDSGSSTWFQKRSLSPDSSFCYWGTIATEVIMHYEPVAAENRGQRGRTGGEDYGRDRLREANTGGTRSHFKILSTPPRKRGGIHAPAFRRGWQAVLETASNASLSFGAASPGLRGRLRKRPSYAWP